MELTKLHRRRLRKGVVTGIGGGVLAFGVVGLVVPVVPGSPIILIGLVILSTEYAWSKRALLKIPQWINRLRGNLPNKKTALTTWIKNFIGKVKKKISRY